MSIIKEEDFDELYKPIQNHIDPNASWSGTLFETYGEEEAYVREQAQKNPKKVWTLLDGDDDMYIVAGFHFVNRVGYIITENEWETGEEECPQEMPKDDEDETDEEYCSQCEGEQIFFGDAGYNQGICKTCHIDNGGEDEEE